MTNDRHTPVLLHEVIEALCVSKGDVYVDATFGQGGHSRSIMERGGKVLAFDWDAEAVARGESRFAEEIKAGTLKLFHANFDQLAEILKDQKLIGNAIHGILFDFGTSRQQLTSSERGFSFGGDGPLDMRMDQRLGVTAADLLAISDERQLTKILFHFGGETQAKKISKMIKQQKTPITTTAQLAHLVSSVVSSRGKLHPATKTFQALRIAVNSELDAIESALPQALEVLGAGGKIVTISFHEGEDRLVKHAFREWEQSEQGTVETKKPITATEEECQQNPPSRSAKMRIFTKK